MNKHKELPRTWSHSRKGRIVGRVVNEDDVWAEIELTEDSRFGDVGDVITARKSLMVEVTE